MDLKALRDKEKRAEEVKQKAVCEKYVAERFGEKVNHWRKEHGKIWFLPVFAEDGETIEKFAIFKPINRTILNYATSKLEDSGLYGFLEAAMMECWIDGDDEIIQNDEYFISSAQVFNKVIESKKVAFIKG